MIINQTAVLQSLEICRSSAPGWQQRGWTGKWSICRSCWTGNNLLELYWFLLLRPASDLQDLQFKFFADPQACMAFKVFTDTAVYSMRCNKASEGSKIPAQYFRQACIFSVWTSGMELPAKWIKVMLWNQSFQGKLKYSNFHQIR